MNKEQKRILLQVLLFVTTFITTTLAGSELCFGRSVFMTDFSWEDVTNGLMFSIPLMAFLTAHEFGHYFMAIYHKVKTSLPYYIPFPPIPFLFNIGTMGAVIRLRSRPESNLKHFDIGLAGPLAGFVVSIAILFYGFATLPPAEYVFKFHPEYQQYGLDYAKHVYEPEFYKEKGVIDVTIGKNLIFLLFENLVEDKTRIPNPHEIMHYPVLMAGLIALLFTCLNLFPIGQLDGGHILYGLIGFKRHKLVASFFFIVLLFYSGLGLEYIAPTMSNNGLLIAIPAYILFLYIAMTGLKLSKRDTAMYAVLIFALQFILVRIFPGLSGYGGWLLFIFFVGRFVGIEHPQSLIEEPLDEKRLVLGWITLLIFFLCFSPAPMTMTVIMGQQ
jgi:membrane-associated protease RseP (regulator of RpoE activity)